MGNPFVHVELSSTDLAAAKKFYKGLFDWKLSDMPMGPGNVYTMIDVGTGVGGGMAKQEQPGAPSAWLTYVAVDSVDKTIAKARKLGARIIVEKQPIPNMGAFGIFADPTGATLGVYETAPAAAAPPPAPAPAKKAAAPAKKKAVAKKPAAKKKKR